MEQKAWWHLEQEMVLNELDSRMDTGLSEAEAARRLEQGHNELEREPGSNPVLMFFNQFTDTMVLVLLAAAVVSAMAGSIADALTIMAIVIVNAVLGFIQEYRAERSLEAIRQLASPHALVFRDKKRKKIPAVELVPGDIVYLETGDRVPADLRIFEPFSLEIDESTLTGESVPVVKQASRLELAEVPLAEQNNMAFMSTVVTRGRGLAVVTATGMNTVMGQIVKIIKESETSLTPLQQKLDRLGKLLIIICTTVCAAVAGLGIFRGEPVLTMFLAGISLAVAAIPEGLPAIVTVVLAVGVQRMARRNAVVRKLPAVETLGCTTVICSDKTGTLTQNKMNAVRVATWTRDLEVKGEGYEPQGQFTQAGRNFVPRNDPALRLLMDIALNCNNALLEKKRAGYDVQGDPTEGALLTLAGRAGVEKELPRLRELPFDSERKMMTVIVKRDEQCWVMSKGALEALLPLCSRFFSGEGMVPFNAPAREHFLKKQEAWAADGCRVLAFAARIISEREARENREADIESQLCLLGVCALLDPPRAGVANAVACCRNAGIVPVMITGDHPATANAIARQIGLTEGSEVLTGSDMDALGDEELYKKIIRTRVFARVSPQHKNRIVKILKRKNEVAAMTGDGVNDAPALKGADIGIAMGLSGTEVAKEASAMVLADDDFSTIVEAVHQGRAIYDNIRKFIRYLLGCNIGEVMVMFLASLAGMPLPLLPIQILWVNLVTDGLPAMALGLEPPEPGIMQRPPRPRLEGVFARGLGYKVFGRGCFIALITLLAFVAGMVYARLNGYAELDLARTMALTTLVMGQLCFVFECRSEKYSPFELGFFQNRFLLAAVGCSLVMQLSLLYLPALREIFHTVALNGWQWLLIMALASPKLLYGFIQYTWRRVFVSGSDYVKINA